MDNLCIRCDYYTHVTHALFWAYCRKLVTICYDEGVTHAYLLYIGGKRKLCQGHYFCNLSDLYSLSISSYCDRSYYR